MSYAGSIPLAPESTSETDPEPSSKRGLERTKDRYRKHRHPEGCQTPETVPSAPPARRLLVQWPPRTRRSPGTRKPPGSSGSAIGAEAPFPVPDPSTGVLGSPPAPKINAFTYQQSIQLDEIFDNNFVGPRQIILCIESLLVHIPPTRYPQLYAHSHGLPP